MALDTGSNLDLFLWVNRIAQRTPWLHGSIEAFAKYGVLLFAVLLLIGLWAARSADDARLAKAGWACVATLLAVAVNQPIVHLVHEARPYATHPHILVLASRSTDPGFPSDHATMAGAAAVGILLASRKLGLFALLAALVLAASRVYIGAHYPLDVLAGLILGAAVAVLGWILVRRILVATVHRIRVLPGLRNVFGPRVQAGTTPATDPRASASRAYRA
ncbi:phosphatase PAP2 family protein [Allobranchiibius sp. CTAmp26]|uniref:phosphatase PAP2 family protein n=1 Tax=Allobranchiibius sp. CTAmp26 TaxID=2815214 RepID=UPI001AA16556|nr:phosphatase PAP2 family protein [Allobranchiibius sp. CTAmp26]MBO1753807.1 phosphatase PAP2 family protein [Allobranchiibius sp. CTAmp26]